ncbi:hypothetical protein SGRA_0829 [Saprospira grandis str. Lewin]|uniref:Uncharacterized protein n=1 Tax=Saprospira grandis (strain Lewin) TaxID=984262 RepID=H6L229_SAPGL|nr:hypothetical protein SGRA_0829 [Saprospira grandis str. Lewin]
MSQLAQRCAAVARSARPRSEATQGRADLRAAKHSGGRPRRSLAGRGPQKKKKLALKIALAFENGSKEQKLE